MDQDYIEQLYSEIDDLKREKEQLRSVIIELIDVAKHIGYVSINNGDVIQKAEKVIINAEKYV